VSEPLDFLGAEDAAAFDRYVAKPTREEREDLKRKQGEAILGMFEEEAKHRQGADPLLEALNQAHWAKASEAEADKQ
jgi:hypothetical protein